MKITITDIAKKAEVSTATVSHVINKTRYVSPELVEKVENIIAQTGYQVKKEKTNIPRIGKMSEVAFVVPNITSVVYAQLSLLIEHYLSAEGFSLLVYLTNDQISSEKHILAGLTSNKRVAGIILVPASTDEKYYNKMVSVGIPFICLDRTIKNDAMDYILSENMEAIYKSTIHLIKNGHEKIGILLELKDLTTDKERLEGYKKALADNGIEFDKELVINVKLHDAKQINVLKHLKKGEFPTAFIAGGNTLTLKLLENLDEIGLECPKDISVIGFGDDEWCDLIHPALTRMVQDTQIMAQKAVEYILSRMKGIKVRCQLRIPVELIIRDSTQIIARGPFGEKAADPDKLVLSDKEIEKLRQGNYKVGISFHNSGTEWTRLHEVAIRETLKRFGVKVVAVTDAHFDPELQITQLESIRMQNPDAIISIPSDEEKTAQKFKEISETIKLILISNLPKGFKTKDYVSCVSVNERENGQNAGKILGEHFKYKKNVKIGLINHGSPFFGTQQRDFAVEQIIMENYPNIEIADKINFYSIDNAYDVCKQMIKEHPDIQGLYISWETPALEAIKALEEMERTDIAIVTVDLDVDIACYMARGRMVIGLSAQRPYDQGVAVAMTTANALLNKTDFKYIGVKPYAVFPKNLSKAWKDITHTPEPEKLKIAQNYVK